MRFALLTHEDVPAVAALEADAYLPALHESNEAFVRLIELYPEGAIACLDEGGLCGYAFGAPSVKMTASLSTR